MMLYKILFTESAAKDLEDIYSYISDNDSEERAIYVMGKIEERIMRLNKTPERGSMVRELS